MKYYLDLYHAWSMTGQLPQVGLCNSIRRQRELKLFKPDSATKFGRSAYWAYSGKSDDICQISSSFCPLRQNIVLFLAAMNGEL